MTPQAKFGISKQSPLLSQAPGPISDFKTPGEWFRCEAREVSGTPRAALAPLKARFQIPGGFQTCKAGCGTPRSTQGSTWMDVQGRMWDPWGRIPAVQEVRTLGQDGGPPTPCRASLGWMSKAGWDVGPLGEDMRIPSPWDLQCTLEQDAGPPFHQRQHLDAQGRMWDPWSRI